MGQLRSGSRPRIIKVKLSACRRGNLSGLSSSAALELCLAYGLLELTKQSIRPEIIAPACQRAENSDLVQSPCGFLDQGVIAFAQKDKMVRLDFSPPVKIKLIPANLSNQGVSLVVAVDKTVKRVLGESGYPARRRSCEAAAKTLKLKSSRELSMFTKTGGS